MPSASQNRRARTVIALMAVEFEELELPFDDPAHEPPVCVVTRDPMGTFPCCPLCGGELRPEHAHYRCACGWRDSCCD